LNQHLNSGALRADEVTEFGGNWYCILSVVSDVEEEFEIVFNAIVPAFRAGLK
jgi:hypothetical protein